jgi:hypothetical protein
VVPSAYIAITAQAKLGGWASQGGEVQGDAQAMTILPRVRGSRSTGQMRISRVQVRTGVQGGSHFVVRPRSLPPARL